MQTERAALPPVTEAQRKYLREMREFQKTYHVCPTYAELADRLFVTKRSVRQALRHLVARGCLGRGPGRNRFLYITTKGLYELRKK